MSVRKLAAASARVAPASSAERGSAGSAASSLSTASASPETILSISVRSCLSCPIPRSAPLAEPLLPWRDLPATLHVYGAAREGTMAAPAGQAGRWRSVGRLVAAVISLGHGARRTRG